MYAKPVMNLAALVVSFIEYSGKMCRNGAFTDRAVTDSRVSPLRTPIIAYFNSSIGNSPDDYILLVSSANDVDRETNQQLARDVCTFTLS